MNMNEEDLKSLVFALKKERDELRALCRTMLPVFEAARPLVLNLERLRDAAKEPTP